MVNRYPRASVEFNVINFLLAGWIELQKSHK